MSAERDKKRHSSGESSIRVAINQDQAQPLTRLRLSPGAIRYMYDRSGDSKASGEPGQDYLSFCHLSDRLAFAVCDGVGGSFLGNLAARFLGDQLVRWLWEYPALVKTERIQFDLSRLLRELIGPASHLIENYPLPKDLPPIVREVLEEQRAYGSETMFVCGRIEWPAQHSPGQVALVWLGDAELQVCDRRGRWRTFVGTSAERWSTSRGTRGDFRILTAPAEEVARVIGYSDGLRSLADDLRLLPDNMLDRALKLLARDPRNDDLSLVDIALDEQSMPAEQGVANQVWTSIAPPATYGEQTALTRQAEARSSSHSSPDPSSSLSPTPEFLSPPNNAIINSGFKLTWTEIPGAEGYMIQEAPDPKFDPDEVLWELVDHTHFIIEQDVPGVYYYRVRAQSSGAQSEWSRQLRIQIQRKEADRIR